MKLIPIQLMRESTLGGPNGPCMEAPEGLLRRMPQEASKATSSKRPMLRKAKDELFPTLVAY
jgi:hypothetical protein